MNAKTLDEITTEQLFTRLAKISQSNQEKVTSSSFRVDINIISSNLRGRGLEEKNKKQMVRKGLLPPHLLNNRCLITIVNDDNKCAAMAIAVAMVHWNYTEEKSDTKDQWNFFCKNGYKEQDWAAEDLCRNVGVNWELGEDMDYADLRKFDEFLSDWNILVYDARAQYRRSYCTKTNYEENSKYIMLYICQGHYFVITNPKAFFKKKTQVLDLQKGIR